MPTRTYTPMPARAYPPMPTRCHAQRQLPPTSPLPLTSASLRLRSANCSVILGFSALNFSISSLSRLSRRS